ncbi:MAG: ABC transporter substrate-binding protein [Chelatococcus sp.]|nr:ABC transporter substrate-binding protein [Chelatococcus sp.]
MTIVENSAAPPNERAGLSRRHVLALSGAASAAALLAGGAVARAAEIEELRIGCFTEPPSLDPHWQNTAASNSLSQHIFDRLFHADENQKPVPALAEGWKVIDPLTWEIALRKDVKFHDDTPFTADDVLFTFERSQNVPNSPFSFKSYLGNKKLEKVDDHLIRIRTPSPNPILINEIMTVSIISRKVGEKATTDDYNRGTAMVGTGPYRFVEWRSGQHIKLERHEGYWGNKPEWMRVMLRPISSNPARVAALLSGDVELIDFVPPSSLERLQSNKALSLSSKVSNRMIYLAFDHSRARSPFVKGIDGSEIDNPLRKLEVRQAISKAINREALGSRALEGMGVPAGQLVPPEIFGSAPELGPDKFSVADAKALLTKAGYPNGFAITLHSSNDRYVNDAAVAEAIAQMLTRIGIRTAVETMPYSVYVPRATGGGPEGLSQFSLFLYGFGGQTGEASVALRSVVATYDKDKGLGSSNRGRYSNPEVDKLIGEAAQELDDTKRAALMAEATRISMADVAVAPIYFPVNYWSAKSGMTYRARTDERTLAMDTLAG